MDAALKAALTDTEIETLAGYVHESLADLWHAPAWTPPKIMDAIHDHKRLVSDLRALRTAVRALDEPIALDDYGDQWCPLCRATRQRNSTLPFGHAPDCPWAVARPLAGEGSE